MSPDMMASTEANAKEAVDNMDCIEEESEHMDVDDASTGEDRSKKRNPFVQSDDEEDTSNDKSEDVGCSLDEKDGASQEDL